MMSLWPDPSLVAEFMNDEAEADFDIAKRLISGLRSIRARYRLSPREAVDVVVKAAPQESARLEAQRDFISKVGFVTSLTVGEHVEKPGSSVSLVDPDFEAYVQLEGLVDFGAEAKRLEKEIKKATGELAGIEKTLSNPGFIAKAAPEIIEAKQTRKAELEATLSRLAAQLEDLSE